MNFSEFFKGASFFETVRTILTIGVPVILPLWIVGSTLFAASMMPETKKKLCYGTAPILATVVYTLLLPPLSQWGLEIIFYWMGLIMSSLIYLFFFLRVAAGNQYKKTLAILFGVLFLYWLFSDLTF